MDVRRRPDSRFDGLPGWPYEPRYTEVGGLRLARVDEGGGDPVALEAWDGPVTVAFGDSDPIFPLAVGESWARRLRDASFVRIEGAAPSCRRWRRTQWPPRS